MGCRQRPERGCGKGRHARRRTPRQKGGAGALEGPAFQRSEPHGSRPAANQGEIEMQSQRRFASSVVFSATLFLAALSALAAAAAKPVVNITTADAKQLSMLARVGLALAQRIVDHRKQ